MYLYIFESGGDVITLRGRRFGSTWLTSRQSFIGDIPAGKRLHTSTMVELITPPLSDGIHSVRLFIENYGEAVYL